MRAIAVAIALVGAFSAGAAAGPDDSDGAASKGAAVEASIELRVATVLADARYRGEPQAMGRALAALGNGVIHPLFEMLCNDRTDGPERLTAVQQAGVLAALQAVEKRALFTFLSSSVATADDIARRTTGLRVIALVGSAEQFPLLLACAVPQTEESWEVVRLARPLDQAFRAALTAVLLRDPSGISVVERTWDEMPVAVRVPVLRAVGQTRNGRGIDVLARALQSSPACECVAVGEIARLAPHAERSTRDWVSPLVREALRATNPQVRQGAAIALGRLDDTGSVRELIDLLSDEHRGVRGSAHWALLQITRVSLPIEHDRWLGWYEGQLDWYESVGPGVVARLSSDDPSAVAEAIRAVVSRPLFASELSRELAPALRHELPDIRRLACSALAELGARWAADAIHPLLEDDDKAVRVAALAALAELDPPPDPSLQRVGREADRSTR